MLVNWLQGAQEVSGHAEAAGSGEHIPWVAEWTNHVFGPAVYKLQQLIMPKLV